MSIGLVHRRAEAFAPKLPAMLRQVKSHGDQKGKKPRRKHEQWRKAVSVYQNDGTSLSPYRTRRKQQDLQYIDVPVVSLR